MGEPCAQSASCWIASSAAPPRNERRRPAARPSLSSLRAQRSNPEVVTRMPSFGRAEKIWIFFQNTLDIPIYMGLVSTCPVPPEGRARGVLVCGAAEGDAGDA